MKKVISLLIAFVFLIPTCSFAETDPAVGMWYFLFDFNINPEFRSDFGDLDSMLTIYYFFEDGKILELDNNLTGQVANQNASTGGKWEKVDNTYKYSMLEFGEGTFTIENDAMLLSLADGNVNMRLRKVIPFNFYKDFVHVR